MKGGHFPIGMVNLTAGLFTLVLGANMYIAARAQALYRPIDPQVSWASLTENDPLLGNSSGRLLRVEQPGDVLIVLALSDCGPCNRDRLKGLRDRILTDHISVLLLIDDLEPRDEQILKRDFPSYTVSKLDASRKKGLNTSFYPRLYAFDAKGRLRYIQPPESPLEISIERAIAEVL